MRSPKTPANPAASLRARARKLMAEQRSSVFRALCKREGVPLPTEEYHFAKPQRNWRFDFAWIEQRVALEVEGGAWTRGRHTRASGFIEDMVKYNHATSLGWRVFRCVPSELDTFATLHLIRNALTFDKRVSA